MSEPKKVQAKLLDARYVEEAQSVVMFLECKQGRFTSQIHRSTLVPGGVTFGNRTEEEITKEMNKYVDILKYKCLGKGDCITAIFDPDLNNKIKDHIKLKY